MANIKYLAEEFWKLSTDNNVLNYCINSTYLLTFVSLEFNNEITLHIISFL